MNPAEFGRVLIIAGLALAAFGGLWLLLGKIPFLGRLPGDLRVEREEFSFYFPLATCLLLSVVLSFLFWIASKLK